MNKRKYVQNLYHEYAYLHKLLNVILVKIAALENRERAGKFLMHQSLDEPVENILIDCFRVIASGTRVYYNSRLHNFPLEDKGLDIVVLKSKVIEQAFSLVNILEQNTDTISQDVCNALKSSIRCGLDWLYASHDHYGDCMEPELRCNKEGLVNRVYIKVYSVYNADEMLWCICSFLRFLKKGVKEANIQLKGEGICH
ncbi:MAG: hypothetical protein AB7G87_03785 [Clostridia bacterium]